MERGDCSLASLGTIVGKTPRRWLVTGAAGFIGSHLVESLLQEGQNVRAVDNFITGRSSNLKEAVEGAGSISPHQYEFFEGDLREFAFCDQIVRDVDVVLHQAALGSVPRSIQDPWSTHDHNVNGFVNMLNAARVNRVRRFIYASSSSVYGNDPSLPKIEDRRGEVLSPYALTKQIGEEYAGIFHKIYNMEVIGLRYFNVFGPRQDFKSPYAAVIPRWLVDISLGRGGTIYGDGMSSRDFCYVRNVVQANLLAGTTSNPQAFGELFNIAVGARTTLMDLYKMLSDLLKKQRQEAGTQDLRPIFCRARPGDIPHSQANIDKAKEMLGYVPSHDLREGLALTVEWFGTRTFSYSDSFSKMSKEVSERPL